MIGKKILSFLLFLEKTTLLWCRSPSSTSTRIKKWTNKKKMDWWNQWRVNYSWGTKNNMVTLLGNAHQCKYIYGLMFLRSNACTHIHTYIYTYICMYRILVETSGWFSLISQRMGRKTGLVCTFVQRLYDITEHSPNSSEFRVNPDEINVKAWYITTWSSIYWSKSKTYVCLYKCKSKTNVRLYIQHLRHEQLLCNWNKLGNITLMLSCTKSCHRDKIFEK